MSRDRRQVSQGDREAFLRALSELDEALDVNIQRAERMKQRIAHIQSALAEGQPLREVVPREETPLLVELLTQSANNLSAYGSRVRRLEARALHQEGLTMEQIAKLFRVTRQRVSALLREGR
jgi:DNA-directed RNA polymerase sigma subunit (sigma70/sigma32)